MRPVFNFTEQDIRSMGIEAACAKAYEQGRLDGSGTSFHSGLAAGAQAASAAFQMAYDVVAVYRNGDHTILEFADGTKTRVTYDGRYGYAYDDEKAIMAAMLKRLTGSAYIRALKEFARRDDGCDGCVPDPGPEHRTNVSRDMVRRDAAEQDLPTTDPVTLALKAARDAEDADFWKEFHDMPKEAGACGTTDPVEMAIQDGPEMPGPAEGVPFFDTDRCLFGGEGVTDPVAKALDAQAGAGTCAGEP